MPMRIRNVFGAEQSTQRSPKFAQIESSVSPSGNGGRDRRASFCFRYSNDPHGRFESQRGQRTSRPLLFGFNSVTTPTWPHEPHGRTALSATNSFTVTDPLP